LSSYELFFNVDGNGLLAVERAGNLLVDSLPVAVDGGDEHLVVLRRQFRLGNLYARFSVLLYPNLGYGVLVTFALVEHMDVPPVVVSVERDGYEDEQFQECELSHRFLVYL
jgi:hypothetical protein